MKLLYYVSFWRKSVRLLGPAGEDIHFQTPVLAGEISALYPDHRLFDSCGAPVPSHSQLKRGSSYILTPAPNSRQGNRRISRSSSASPSELRRVRSARPWHPSLERISEDGAATIPRKKKVQAMRKPANHWASRPKSRDVIPGDGLYNFSPTRRHPDFGLDLLGTLSDQVFGLDKNSPTGICGEGVDHNLGQRGLLHIRSFLHP